MPENIIQIDQNLLETRLDRLVAEKVAELLNAMLDAEADEIANAAKYERTGERKAYRAGHYDRSLTAKAGRLGLKVPKLKGEVFESAIIERHRRREESVDPPLSRQVPARWQTRGSELIIVPWTAMVQSAHLFGHYREGPSFTGGINDLYLTGGALCAQKTSAHRGAVHCADHHNGEYAVRNRGFSGSST